MPKFDPATAKSTDARTLDGLRDLLAEIAAFQELAGAASKEEALTRIVYGVHATPPDMLEYSARDFAERQFEAHIHPSLPSAAVALLDAAGVQPNVHGEFEIDIRRHVRALELVDDSSRNDLYLWFFDCVAATADGLIAAYATRSCPRIYQVDKLVEAAWGSYEQAAAQDDFLWARLRAHWGEADLQ